MRIPIINYPILKVKPWWNQEKMVKLNCLNIDYSSEDTNHISTESLGI